MFLNIYKDWPNDAHVGSFPSSMEKFKEMEKTLMDENNYRVYINFVSFIFEVFFSLQV